MSNGYNFYIQACREYDTDTYKGELDIEEAFSCKYVSFTGLMENGVPRTYTEEFAEARELQVYTPEPKDMTYASTEVKLSLLFEAKDYAVQQNEMAFQKFILGREVVYHDTFRNKYFHLLAAKAATKVIEKLYGKKQYREVTYSFTNLAGTYYDENPLTTK